MRSRLILRAAEWVVAVVLAVVALLIGVAVLFGIFGRKQDQ